MASKVQLTLNKILSYLPRNIESSYKLHRFYMDLICPKNFKKQCYVKDYYINLDGRTIITKSFNPSNDDKLPIIIFFHGVN